MRLTVPQYLNFVTIFLFLVAIFHLLYPVARKYGVLDWYLSILLQLEKGFLGPLAVTVLVCGFGFAYTLSTQDPKAIAEQLSKRGGLILGTRSQVWTEQYISRITLRLAIVSLALSGGLILAAALLISPDLHSFGIEASSSFSVYEAMVIGMLLYQAGSALTSFLAERVFEELG